MALTRQGPFYLLPLVMHIFWRQFLYNAVMKFLFVLFALFFSAVTLANESVYIDVRTWAEHQLDNIEGDARIHVSEIVEGVEIRFPDKTTPIRLYCARGVRAQTATDRLKAAGYIDVENLGGIENARATRSSDNAE